MADALPTTVVNPPQTDPAAAGSTTTEFYIAKIVTVLSSVAAVLGFGMDIATKLKVFIPTSPWVDGALVVAGIVGACISQLIYTLSRVSIKTALIAAKIIPTIQTPTQDQAVAVLNR